MMNGKTTVGVIFGSRSVEHDVSIVTAQQVMRTLNPSRYDIVPIYITRDGRWLTGEPLHDIKTFQGEDVLTVKGVQETHLSSSTGHKGLMSPPLVRGFFKRQQFQKIDVIFPTVHGSHGEDGTLQGLLEMVDLPYVGTGVMASAIANNKVLTKAVLRDAGIPVVEAVAFTRHEWLQDEHRERILNEIEAMGYPAFVKPSDLGSSIGIARVDDRERALLHIDIAANFSRQVLVEKAVVGCIEINCAVMGNHEIQTSVLEQPLSAEAFLSYEEKYMRGGEGGVKQAGMKGADRIIPAPISEELTATIQDIARRGFMAIGGQGTARIDFLVKPDENEVYLNEFNTMPGSLAFYLWEATGMNGAAVCDELVRLAKERYEEKRRTTFDFKNPLIEHVARRGLSGIKK
ncbi:MAG: D-alanine--D-alanine ligase [Chloroflexi bacterium]|nr:D-alanine--D-alanine ligase [Chloroflexota bacterium]